MAPSLTTSLSAASAVVASLQATSMNSASIARAGDAIEGILLVSSAALLALILVDAAITLITSKKRRLIDVIPASSTRPSLQFR
jgi:hypothetical protein